MINKKVSFVIASLFAFVLLLGVASAALTVSNIAILPQESGSFDVTVSSDLNETVNLSIADITSGSDTITFVLNESALTLDDSNNRSVDITVNYTVSAGFDFDEGELYSTELILDAENSTDLSEDIEFKVTGYCGSIPNEGELEITDLNFDVKVGYGDEDDYWYLLDQVEVEVEVNNDGNWDIKDIEVEWELRTTDGVKIMDGDESDFDLRDGKDTVIIITFTLDEDLDEFDSNDVIFYVKATGEIDDSDSAYDEDDTCAYDSKEVDVVTEDDFVIVSTFMINGEEIEGDEVENALSCGQTVEVQGTVYNIGEDDMEDVYVEIYNRDLGIDETIDIGDVDAFENEEFIYTFTLDKDAEEKLYGLIFEVYDEDNDIFENGEDDKSKFTLFFNLEGNCKVDLTPTVGAILISEEVIEGHELLIKATIFNDDSTAMFTINAGDYDSWAELIEIAPKTDIIEVGKEKEFIFKFMLKDDSVGSQTFNVIVTSDDQIVSTQSVSVEVEEGAFDLIEYMKKFDLMTVAIIALNVILLLAIIIVAIKVLRRK